MLFFLSSPSHLSHLICGLPFLPLHEQMIHIFKLILFSTLTNIAYCFRKYVNIILTSIDNVYYEIGMVIISYSYLCFNYAQENLDIFITQNS